MLAQRMYTLYPLTGLDLFFVELGALEVADRQCGHDDQAGDQNPQDEPEARGDVESSEHTALIPVGRRYIYTVPLSISRLINKYLQLIL